MAIQAATVDDVFDKLHFVDEIGTHWLPSQVREEGRPHSTQDTSAVIHEENQMSRFVSLGLINVFLASVIAELWRHEHNAKEMDA